MLSSDLVLVLIDADATEGGVARSITTLSQIHQVFVYTNVFLYKSKFVDRSIVLGRKEVMNSIFFGYIFKTGQKTSFKNTGTTIGSFSTLISILLKVQRDMM